MKVSALRGVVLLLTLWASVGGCAEEPASASPTPSTHSAWFSRVWQSEEGLPGNTVVGVALSGARSGGVWIGAGTRVLKCSAATVRTHLQHIYEKLHVHCRTEAAAKYRSPAPRETGA